MMIKVRNINCVPISHDLTHSFTFRNLGEFMHREARCEKGW